MAAKTKEIIKEKDVEIVEAESVNIKQSSVRAVDGGHIEMQQVGALSIDGDRIEVTQGAACILRGNDVSLNQSISAVTAGNNVSLNFSLSPMVVSKEEAVSNKSAVGVMAAMNIKVKNSTSVLMIANNVEGNVTTLFDWRAAVAMGAVFGGVWGLFSLFRKR